MPHVLEQCDGYGKPKMVELGLVCNVRRTQLLNSPSTASIFLVLSAVASYAVSPLLFRAAEGPLVVFLLLSYHTWLWLLLRRAYSGQGGDCYDGSFFRLTEKQWWYLCGMGILHAFVAGMCPILLPSLQFLPLLAVSVYCGVGVVWSTWLLW